MRTFLLAACAACLASCTTSAGEPGDAAESAVGAPTFENPVVPSDCPDPGVLRVDRDEGPLFVMVCTGGRFRIRTSTDLVAWTDTGKSIFPEGKPPWAKNGRRDWAPEIHRVAEGRFVAYYTAADEHDKLAIGAAWAADPLGPYTDAGRPLVQHAIGVIDATYFADHDGRRYLYWKVDGNQRAGGRTPIMVRELSEDGTSFSPGSEAREVLDRAEAWEGPLVEAPWVVERGGKYFLFYSADVYDERYVTGVARASSPLGPFTRKEGPILVSNARWLGPGHGSVVRHEGVDWFVHHAWASDGRGGRARERGRQVLLDRIEWKGGWPSFAGGSSAIGPQPMP